MHNNIFSPTYQYNPPSYTDDNQDLEDHFNTLLGESQSRYTAAQTIVSSNNNEETFHSNRMFVMGTLESWGMAMGTLAYSRDNELTLKCILDLIYQKQKDIDYKAKIKQQLNAVNFEKQKYQSLLKQSKNTISEKQRLLGKIQNQSTQLKKKIKLIEAQAKKEKNDDQKMIMMLKSKNDHLLHQIKKKQADILKIKDQMKRSVVAKSSLTAKNNQSPNHKNENVVKNTFQLIQKIQRVAKGEKWKKNITQRNTQTYSQSMQEQKFAFMMDKYEKEKKAFSNQNTLLRGKIFQIREVLAKFAEWIEVELYGQSIQSAKKYLEKKFICNHNLMFSKNALLDDLVDIINDAKNGIQQLQDRLQQSEAVSVPSSKSIQSPTKNKKVGFTNPSSKSIGSESNPHFKKKSTSIRESHPYGGSSPANTKSQKSIRDSQKEIRIEQKQRINPSRQRITEFKREKSPQIFRATYQINAITQQSMPSEIRRSGTEPYFNELQLSVFENDILSDIHENSCIEDPDHSIVSHISASELLKQIEKGRSGKYDKWDILFKTEGDEEGEN